MIRLFLLCALGAAPAIPAQGRPPDAPAGHQIVEGVDLDAVDWATLCPNVQPLALTRGGGTCKKVHPASVYFWQHYNDFTGRGLPPPPPNCEGAAREYDRYVKPRNSGDRWGLCREAFRSALRARSPESRIEYSDMPFGQWREKYFGPWLKMVP